MVWNVCIYTSKFLRINSSKTRFHFVFQLQASALYSDNKSGVLHALSLTGYVVSLSPKEVYICLPFCMCLETLAVLCLVLLFQCPWQQLRNGWDFWVVWLFVKSHFSSTFLVFIFLWVVWVCLGGGSFVVLFLFFQCLYFVTHSTKWLKNLKSDFPTTHVTESTWSTR